MNEKCDYLRDIETNQDIINDLSINQEETLVSASNAGKLNFYHYPTGYQYQSIDTYNNNNTEEEHGIFATSFDRTGTRLITCEADKTIKIWKQ